MKERGRRMQFFACPPPLEPPPTPRQGKQVFEIYTILHLCSVDPRKLCVGVNYYTVHTYVQYAILHLW